MTVISKSSVKALFETGDQPSQSDFGDLIDTAVRNVMVAIATAAEGGGIGIVNITGSTAVTLVSASPLGLAVLGAVTTASAQSQLGVLLGIDALAFFATASTAEAEAGTESGLRAYTPTLVKNAIAALETSVTQAVQADIEAETNEDTYIPPDLVRHSPGVAKVWCKWEQSGAHSILASYNMTSVTDGGAVGTTDHIFDTDFSSAEYAVLLGAEDNTDVYTKSATFAAGTLTTQSRDGSGEAGIDQLHNAMAIFGDQ